MTNPYINSTDLFPSIVTISLNAHFTSIIYGLVNFGDAIVFFMVHEAIGHFFPKLTTIPGVSEENQLRSVIFLIALRSFAQGILAVKLIYKDSKWRLLKYILPVASVTCLVGCFFLDSFVHTWWMRPLLGTIFGIFGLITVGIRIRKSMMLKKNKQPEVEVDAEKKNDVEMKAAEEQKNDQDDDIFPGSPPQEFVHASKVISFEQDEKNDNATSINVNNIQQQSHQMGESKSVAVVAEEEDDEEKRQNARANDPEYLLRVRPWMILAGAGAGWLGGSINVGGPPFIVASLLLEFPRELARATFPFISFTVYFTRFWYTLATGSFFDPTIFSIPHAIGVVSGSLVGIYVGDKFGRVVSNEQYLQIASILLVCAGFSIGGASVWITWGFFGTCCVWFVWVNFCKVK